MNVDLALNAFVTLFVTIDPIGMIPIFIALTQGMNSAERSSVALRGATIALCLLTLFTFAGTIILSALGITLHAFRIAGGFLLFYIAFEMIFERRQMRRESASDTAITKDDIANVAAFPLAIPLIAGPGSISAVILLSGQFNNDLRSYGILIGVVIAVLAILIVTFMLAAPIDRFLGTSGRIIMTRLMGVLLAALSVQFVVDGIAALWHQKI
ncbi:MAG: MarC family protein [Hyphomicrobiales bacterium]|nr:MarC family protein [Hyphomicrobiales bacterium]